MSDENPKNDSDRAREIERARVAHSEARVKQVESETKSKLNEALKSFVESDDLPEDDSKVHNLRQIVGERGVEWMPKASAAPTIADGSAPTRPSAEHPSQVQEYVKEWRSPLAASVHATGPTSAPKILVIDDDQYAIDVLASILGERGYRVWQAHDGFEGVIRLLEMPTCDLILLDVQMPRVDGLEFIRYFDKSPYAHIPVVIISGGRKPAGDYDDRFVFLGKPLDVDSLIEVVENQIKAGRKRV